VRRRPGFSGSTATSPVRHGFDRTAPGFARIAALIEARDDDR
jgi:hypothetical protein